MEQGVLFISPHHADAGTLTRMLAPVALPLHHVCGLREAARRLERNSYGVILTAAQLPDGDWKDVLNLAEESELSPAVIVTDRLADDIFWAEILNLGAYDLLVQPFDAAEVQRILPGACAQSTRKPVSIQESPRPRTASAAI